MSIPENAGSKTDPTRNPEILPVTGRRDWRAFHRVPAAVQGGDPCFVAPLELHARQAWSRRHPYFRHARAQAWIALRDGRPVGRVSAQIDELQAGQGRAGLGQFGQIEGIDDPSVFEALLGAAATWLRGQGMSRMQGPFDLSINQQCGLLVDGFESPPMMMMGHAQPWYGEHVQAAGLRPVADLLAYHGRADRPFPAAARRVTRAFDSRIRTRALDRREIEHHAETLRGLFNDAWSGNWGYLPMTREEFAHVVSEMKALVRPGYVQLAFVDDEPAAFMVTLPNLNEIIDDLGGRLLPFGGVRLFWRLIRGRWRSARIPLMGVAGRHRGSLLGAALAFRMMQETQPALVRDGIEVVEQSWVLEQNSAVRSVIESIGLVVYKRYRLYEQEL